MIKKIEAKAKSSSGASLSMALLLFLVCTVVGTVVLTAATAASGRAAELAEMDQRYYSVSSAARLLAKELNGKYVEFVRTIKETATVGPEESDPVRHYSAKISNPDIMLFSTEKEDTDSNHLEDILNPESNPAPTVGLLTRLTVYMMFDNDTNFDDANKIDYYKKAMEWTLDDYSDRPHNSLFSISDNGTFYIIPCPSDESLRDTLKVSCQWRIEGTTLYIDVSNYTTQPNEKKYTLTVAVEPSFETEPFKIEEDASLSNISVNEDEGETKVTTTWSKKSRVTWKVKSITKGC